jgi:uncharacterized membrane protein
MKKYFLAGIIILLPITLTLWLVVLSLDLLTNPFLSIMEKITPHHIALIFTRIAILFVLIGFIIFLGFLARMIFFDYLIKLMNTLFSKVPFVKKIYMSVTDISKAVFSLEGRKAFRQAVLVSLSEKSVGLGFISGEVPKDFEDKTKKKLVPVVIPTAPHPTSGWFLFVPEEKVRNANISNEEALKLVIACGAINLDKGKKRCRKK